MPYAKKRTTRTRRATKRPAGVRKRTYKKRTNFRPQRVLRVGFPKTTLVKLRYVEGVTIDPGIGTLGTYNFRANSCFDPNLTGVGHQPMNFDLWSQLYNHYTVIGARITAQLFDDTATYASGILFGINLSDDSTFTSDASTMMEQGLSRYRMGNAGAADNKGLGLVVSKGFSCKKFFNITNPTDNTARVGAPITANPAELAHFIIFMGATPGSAIDFASHRICVKIDYIVIFSEPKEQPQS